MTDYEKAYKVLWEFNEVIGIAPNRDSQSNGIITISQKGFRTAASIDLIFDPYGNFKKIYFN